MTDFNQSLFNHLYEQHGMIALATEMQDIVDLVHREYPSDKKFTKEDLIDCFTAGYLLADGGDVVAEAERYFKENYDSDRAHEGQ